MNDILRPIIVLSAIIPATILAYLPIKNHLKTSKLKLFGILIPSLVGLCILCGLICCYFKLNLIFPVIPITIYLLQYTAVLQIYRYGNLQAFRLRYSEFFAVLPA